MNAATGFAHSELFIGLETAVVDDVKRLMRRQSFAAGEFVFRQGHPGDRLILVVDGELEVLLESPGAPPQPLDVISAGQIVGELSLLGDGVRTATVRAMTPTTVWVLDRTAFDVLRHDLRPAASAVMHAIGMQAVQRLDRLYRRCADELDEANEEHPCRAITSEARAGHGDVDYLAGLLFFRDLTREQIIDVTEGLPCRAMPRGAILTPAGDHPSALWIVLRGAIETQMRGANASRALRLAGPGRAVGHIGLLGPEAFVVGVESRARERSVLIEVPWPSITRLLSDGAPGARRFAAALFTDVVRALQHGERPLARTRTKSPTASGRDAEAER